VRTLSRGLRWVVPVVALGAAGASCALAGFTVLDDAPPSGAGGAAASTSTSTGSTSTATTTTPPADAGTDAAACGLATYPGPPALATPAGGEEFVVAIRTIDLGDKSKVVPGLDLDGKCTCITGKVPAGCCQADGPSCLMATKACDGARGVDNAGASIFSMIKTFLGNFGSDFYSKRAEEGAWSTLFRVRDYNGQPDDDRVEFSWYASAGFEFVDGGTPAWDGHDKWRITEDSVLPGDGGAPSLDAPKWTDTKAYVTDGVLVAAMPSSVLRLASPNGVVELRVSAGFVVARVEPLAAGEGYALTDGVIVFRWKVADVFYALSSYRDQDGAAICTNSAFYKTGRGQLCSLPDITVEASSPTKPCDALSVGVGFKASPAKLGSLVKVLEQVPGCAPEFDPQFDTCPAQ
jgi:hypothetical protein